MGKWEVMKFLVNIVLRIIAVMSMSQLYAPLLEAGFFTPKNKSAGARFIEQQDAVRQERFKQNVINAPLECAVLNGGYSQQIVLTFDRPLYCESELKDANQKSRVLVLKFPQMSENDFKAIHVKDQLVAFEGITSVDLSSEQEQGVSKVVLTVVFDSSLIDLKMHKAAKSKYLKIDSFSRAKLNQLAFDHHRIYSA
jgi:hypothetical protein